jgi:hypothetical protein
MIERFGTSDTFTQRPRRSRPAAVLLVEGVEKRLPPGDDFARRRNEGRFLAVIGAVVTVGGVVFTLGHS